jgi:hypothetical protein
VTKYDAHKIIEDAVTNAMKSQEAFVRNLQKAVQDSLETNSVIGTRLALYAELKKIRIALTDIAQILAERSDEPSTEALPRHGP